MTVAQQAAWQAYIDQCKDALGLKDWRIELEREPHEDESAAASVTVTYGQKHALVWLGAKWGEYAPEQQRYYVAHECLHCHLKPLADVVHNLARRLSSDTYGVISGCHDDALEGAIDGIGWAVAAFLPLPPAFVEPAKEAV